MSPIILNALILLQRKHIFRALLSHSSPIEKCPIICKNFLVRFWVDPNLILPNFLNFLINLLFLQFKWVIFEVRSQEKVLNFAIILSCCFLVLRSFKFLITEPFLKGLKVFYIIFFNEINLGNFNLLGLKVKLLQFLGKLLLLFVFEIFFKNYQQNLLIYICKQFQQLVFVKLINLDLALLAWLGWFCLVFFNAFYSIVQEVKRAKHSKSNRHVCSLTFSLSWIYKRWQ